MNSTFIKLHELLGKNRFVIAAFLIPIAIRSIPEVLSWSYPLGFDTLTIAPIIQSGDVFSGGLVNFFHGTNMLYLFTTLLYDSTGNVVFVLKFFGPLLLAILCGTLFIYARKALQWGNWKSLLVSILTATYFVSLRDSWDLYRQTLGLIFLIGVLISLAYFRSPKKYYVACPLMVLTVLSHELASVILLFIVLVEASRLLIKKSFKESAYLLGSATLAAGVFLFQRVSLEGGSTFGVPTSYVASGPSVALALYMGGLLVYCYFLILPLAIIGLFGFKASSMHYWALLCVGIPVLLMINPNLPLYFWDRWDLLLVYPLLFFAAQGMDNLWRFWANHKSMIKRLTPKIFAVAYLILLLSFSGFYMTMPPGNQISFFSTDNPYLAFVPSSMLQNALPIDSNPGIINCFNWINSNSSSSSILVVHYALEGLASIYVKNVRVVTVPQDTSTWGYIQNESALAVGMVDAAQTAIMEGNSSAYTVWWVSGQGWYDIPSLPPSFIEIFHSGSMAVYSFNSTS